MSNAYYPPIDEATIRMLPVLAKQLQAEGSVNYLQGSPYKPEICEILRQHLLEKMGPAGPANPLAGSGDSEEDLAYVEKLLASGGVERELASLYGKLSRFGNGLTAEDTSEMASFFRVSTSLMTKIVELQEKASGISQFIAFKNRVMGLLSDVMSVDQRNVFMEALERDFGAEEKKTQKEPKEPKDLK